MIRVVLAGGPDDLRAELAGQLAERLGIDGSVFAAPPADPVAFDADLARRGEEVDALLHLGGAPDALLDHYGRAVIEVRTLDVDDILAALREALVAG